MRQALFLAVLLCACSQINPDTTTDAPLKQMSFCASSEAASSEAARGEPSTTTDTKTTLSSGRKILWSTKDAVTLFAATGAQGSKFTVTSIEDGGAVATFGGLSPESANGYYYALSPASETARLVSTSGTILCSIPTEQKGVENSFDPAAVLSLARVNAQAQTSTDILHFKNAGALLSFSVPGNYINRVKIESRDGSAAMSGPANVSYNDGEPTVSPTTAAKNYIEVSVPTGSAGKIFYAITFPGDYSKGFYVTFYTSSNAYNRYSSTEPLSLKRNGNCNLIRRNWTQQDDRPQATESGTELIAPVIESGGQISPTSARIKFSCASGKRDSYKFFIRDAASYGEGTKVGELNTGSAQYGSYQRIFSGLTTGASYDLGVCASCKADPSYTDSPVTWLEDITVNTAASDMSVSVESSAANYYNFVINYKISGLSSSGAEHGLVFSYSSDKPECESDGPERILPGPVISTTGEVRLSQCVPNAALRPGETCYIRAYCHDADAGCYVYSPVQQLTLPAQPQGYSISKTELESPGEGISLYSFKAGGSWNGFCAEAECDGAVKLKVNNAPMGKSSAISMASQLQTSGAAVLINGQIFGSQGNIGVAYTGGQLRYNNASDDGIANCHSYGNNSSSWQPITRAILGVDANGKPGAYWCSVINGQAYFFDRPTPAGSAVYPQVSATSGPGPARCWSPQEALSTGPMLLYDGKVCVSEDLISTGVYYTNYELWSTKSGDIYGSSRPRTALGFNSVSGKMYLAVVTSGATMTAMARIMKGLGCNYAMNLDGGGSTQMSVAGKGELTGNARNVKSTVGFICQ